MAVVTAMVGAVEGRVPAQLPGQETGCQGNPGDDPDLPGARLREEELRGTLAEDVVDDLDGLDARVLDRLEPLLDPLDADPVVGEHPVGAQLVEVLEESRAVVAVGGQAMELDQIEGGDAQVLAAPLRPLAKVRARVLGHVDGRAPSDLGGDDDALAGPLAEEAADQPLAASVAVDVGGIEESRACVIGSTKCGHGRGVIHSAPIAPDRPGSEADLADRQSGAAKLAVAHLTSPCLLSLGFPLATPGQPAAPSGPSRRRASSSCISGSTTMSRSPSMILGS